MRLSSEHFAQMTDFVTATSLLMILMHQGHIQSMHLQASPALARIQFSTSEAATAAVAGWATAKVVWDGRKM